MLKPFELATLRLQTGTVEVITKRQNLLLIAESTNISLFSSRKSKNLAFSCGRDNTTLVAQHHSYVTVLTQMYTNTYTIIQVHVKIINYNLHESCRPLIFLIPLSYLFLPPFPSPFSLPLFPLPFPSPSPFFLPFSSPSSHRLLYSPELEPAEA